MPASTSSISNHAKRAHLAGKNIGLSISDNADRTQRGFDRIHQNTFMYEIARTLYRRGASISYGGHLGNEGFTGASLQFLIDEQQSAIKDQRIQSYVAWPLQFLSSGVQDDFSKFADIKELPAPKEFSGAKNEFLDSKPIPNRYYWFRSLTALRQEMNSKIDARVVLGGKTNGFIGRYPGIVEEVLFAVRTRTPVYLCGGFGGAACALSQLFYGDVAPDLDSDSKYSDEHYAASVSYYEAASALKLGTMLNTTTPYERFVGHAVDYRLLCEFFRVLGVAGLNNGLSPQENQILFETPSLDEIRTLVLTGLKRLFLVSQEFASPRNESGILPEAAFEQAMQSASGRRSPLINSFQAFALDSADELLSLESALFPLIGSHYLDVRQPALQKCAPAIIEQFNSISNARALLSLDLAALGWIPARSNVSVIGEFLAELSRTNPVVAELDTVRKHFPTADSVSFSPTTNPKTSSIHIDGPTQAKLSKAIQRAFPNPKLLRTALLAQLNDDIWNYAGMDDEYPDVRFKMISQYNARYKICQLVSSLLDENPTNGELLEFAWRQQILKRPSGPEKNDPEDGSLERMLEPARGFTDVSQLLQRLGKVVNSVCQISYPLAGGVTYGTGFLIGNGTVLTNWHVVKDVTAANRSDVRFKFDYRTAPDGVTLSAGVEYRLVDGEDWLIDHSPYATEDNWIRTIDEDKALDRSLEFLDYAVLRVSGEPGNNPIGGNASENAELRGCLSLDDAIDVPTNPQSAVWCFQHPYENGQSLPQQVDWNKPALFGSNPNKSRVWYEINTRPGSSGSPILTNKIELIALHHAGGKDWPAPGQYLYNRGIPLVAIRNLLKQRGKLVEIK